MACRTASSNSTGPGIKIVGWAAWVGILPGPCILDGELEVLVMGADI